MIKISFFKKYSIFALTIVAIVIFISAATLTAQVSRTAFVHLFEWKWSDIEKECEYLGKKGYGAVQISPPNEHRIYDDGTKRFPWWQRYQPVSYKVDASRSGTLQEFIEMVEECNTHGVKIYADIVINHMAAGSGNGTSGTPYNENNRDYTVDHKGKKYSGLDFHSQCSINWDSPTAQQIQQCWIAGGGLPDLKTESSWVKDRIVDYMNDLISIGVAGFRIDAAKHMEPGDIFAIVDRLSDLREDLHGSNQRPYIFQEVIFGENQPVKPVDYANTIQDSRLGITEFRYGTNISFKFRDDLSGKLSDFIKDEFPSAEAGWGMLHSSDAVVFTDNHDNQRGHGSGYWVDINGNKTIGGIVTNFFNGSVYNLANVFMLAWPYGYPKVIFSPVCVSNIVFKTPAPWLATINIG